MKSILLIGCGRMGGAMLARWLNRADIGRVDVVDPHILENPLPDKVWGFSSIAAWSKNARQVDMVVLAIKPQRMETSCEAIRDVLNAQVPVMSVVTGYDLTRLTQLLGDRPLIRAMPNTAARIGKGVTGYCVNARTTAAQLDMAVALIKDLGLAIPLQHEDMMDALTAVSGSGPAYYYLFTEMLEAAGVAAGLPKHAAALLARHTFIGAGALLEAESEKTPHDLRAEVTSPGGTTQAAIERFNTDEGLAKLVKGAVNAAVKRAKELGRIN